MKKYLAILAIPFFFLACSQDSSVAPNFGETIEMKNERHAALARCTQRYTFAAQDEAHIVGDTEYKIIVKNKITIEGGKKVLSATTNVYRYNKSTQAYEPTIANEIEHRVVVVKDYHSVNGRYIPFTAKKGNVSEVKSHIDYKAEDDVSIITKHIVRIEGLSEEIVGYTSRSVGSANAVRIWEYIDSVINWNP